jgi:hypothetical protein
MLYHIQFIGKHVKVFPYITHTHTRAREHAQTRIVQAQIYMYQLKWVKAATKQYSTKYFFLMKNIKFMLIQ